MKTIPQYPKYEISEDGKIVRNTKTGKILNQSGANGYLAVTLLLDEGQYVLKRIGVHRLVGFTYLATPPIEKIWINHKDGNRSNNHYINLEWTTISENIQHSFDVLNRKRYKGAEHWLYGKKLGIVTRATMSAKKKGENHPKFKGWYTIGAKRYASLNEAAEKENIDRRRLKKMCLFHIDNCSFIAR